MKRVKPDNIKVTRVENVTTVAVNYEAGVPVLGNIDLICTFAKIAAFR